MLKLNYVDESDQYDISFSKMSGNVVSIIGNYPIKTVGFYLSRDKHQDMWDYTKFTTIYKELVEGAMFSNDGSVAPPDPEPEPEPDPDDETNE